MWGQTEFQANLKLGLTPDPVRQGTSASAGLGLAKALLPSRVTSSRPRHAGRLVEHHLLVPELLHHKLVMHLWGHLVRLLPLPRVNLTRMSAPAAGLPPSKVCRLGQGRAHERKEYR